MKAAEDAAMEAQEHTEAFRANEEAFDALDAAVLSSDCISLLDCAG